MEKVVSHKGKVVAIGQKSITVQIVSESACSTCHAAGLCGASESELKKVEVSDPFPSRYQIGQEVEVCLARRKGMRAVLLSYVIPLIILLILILSLQDIGLGELLLGCVSVAGVLVYYLVLYLFRNVIAEDYGFFIRID